MMTKRFAVTMTALLAAPLILTAAEPYQYYPEGYDPANPSQTLASAPFALETGAKAVPSEKSATVDLRSRSEDSDTWSIFDSFKKFFMLFIR